MPNPAFMHRCLDLASLGRGRVGNGALVGAVLVRNDKIIAEGFHRAYGEVHAERMLLESYQDEIRPDDVLYVNLEPCCHQGKTPPCTDILLSRGVKHVVYGMQDPDGRVSGKGIKLLQKAGVTVTGSLEKTLSERLNKGFIQSRITGRPWVTIKKAIDRADRISKDDGSPLKITSSEQDKWSHHNLRATHDAILVGIGTVLSDNPRLSIRFEQTEEFSFLSGLNGKLKNEKKSFQPYRIVLDSRCLVPMDANVVSNASIEKTIVCVDPEASKGNMKKIQELRSRGVIVLEIPVSGGSFVWGELWKALITPSGNYHGITSILVEGGRRTWDEFEGAGFCDEAVTLIGDGN